MASLNLSGSLQDFPLADIVRLLQATRRTGRLTLNADDSTGTIDFERGEIIDSQSNQLSGLDAIRYLALFSHGTFEFFDNMLGSSRTLAGAPTLETIEVLENRVMESRQIQELMPLAEEVPHYLGGVLPPGFEVAASELAVVMKAASGTMSTARLARELGLDLTGVRYTLARFRALGLVEVREGVVGEEAPPAPEAAAPAAPASPAAAQPKFWRGRRIG